MPILLCFQKNQRSPCTGGSVRPGTLHASEVRPADLRDSGPRFASGKCLRHFPRSSAGAGIPTGSPHTPMTSCIGSSRLNRAPCNPRPPICSGAGCLDWDSVRSGGLFRRRPSSLPPARKPRAAVPSAHGSMSTPPFFVEKTAGSSAWSSDMVGRQHGFRLMGRRHPLQRSNWNDIPI